mmetsp:Transcript_2202/g.3473  ORF Transcript_2202/g.3473 Transcript_2202/m.3473 type:complete len:408 (-) Transcript_2202:178-1401(-)
MKHQQLCAGTSASDRTLILNLSHLTVYAFLILFFNCDRILAKEEVLYGFPPSTELLNTRFNTKKFHTDINDMFGISARCDATQECACVQYSTYNVYTRDRNGTRHVHHLPESLNDTEFTINILPTIRILYVDAYEFAYPESIKDFRVLLQLLDIMPIEVVLIIAGSDEAFPSASTREEDRHIVASHWKIMQHGRVSHAFVENLGSRRMGSKVSLLPLGLVILEGSVFLGDFQQYMNDNITSKHLKFTNFNRERPGNYWDDRRAMRLFAASSWRWSQYDHNTTVSWAKNDTHHHHHYLKTLSSALFTICEHGGGFDLNPKMWEALLVGTIPIVRRGIFIEMLLEQVGELPIVVVDGWTRHTIREHKLLEWKNEMMKHFTPEGRKLVISKLTLDYWWENILSHSYRQQN